MPVVVDNGSTDDTLQLITRQYPLVRLLRMSRNCGYGAALNYGVAHTNGEIVILANADVVFPIGSISEMRAYLTAHQKVGVVGPQQVFPDGAWQRSYGDLPGVKNTLLILSGIGSLHTNLRRLVWPRRVDRHPKNVEYIDGAVMVIRKSAFNTISGFDEAFFFYGEDADFCLRLEKLGWRVVFLPSVVVTHLRGGSSTRVDAMLTTALKLHISSKRLFMKKHRPRWQHGIYYRLERLHAQKMVALHRLVAYVCPYPRKERLLRRVAEFTALSQLWRRELSG